MIPKTPWTPAVGMICDVEVPSVAGTTRRVRCKIVGERPQGGAMEYEARSFGPTGRMEKRWVAADRLSALRPSDLIRDRFIKVLCSHLRLSAYKILPSDTFQSLGMDDLDILEVILLCEIEFGVEIPRSFENFEFDLCATVSGVASLLEAMVSALPDPAPGKADPIPDYPPVHQGRPPTYAPDPLLVEESKRALARFEKKD